ncbi:MAG TPA: hypothetical protein PKA33_21755 [Amaricoccus sp.]|uniref:helix-turn-helix transcriptional regulator n=1 Tax=Amaricoccus sp. TaxID=1872485 RepID=UPI002B849693|nr:hypothetical protein [Amaricoccus sp.]HMR54948.1 hypothetical protein [Amaricoccus sp.]HMU01952.1 hypothetical protein [Amaricoccus sp.]
MSTKTDATVVPIHDAPAEIAHLRVVDERTMARLLSVSPAQAERMRKVGSGPAHIRLSERRIGYRIADVEAWLQSRLTPVAES